MPSLFGAQLEAQDTLSLHGNVAMSSTATSPEVIEIDSDSDSDRPISTLRPLRTATVLQRRTTRSPQNAITPRLRTEIEPLRQHGTGEADLHRNGFGLPEGDDDNPGEQDDYAHALGLIQGQNNQRRFPDMQPYHNHGLPQTEPANHLPRQFPYAPRFAGPAADRAPVPLRGNMDPDLPIPTRFPSPDLDFYEFLGNGDLNTPFRFASPTSQTMPPTLPTEPAEPAIEFDIVLQQVAEIFPDICSNYVREIYDDRVALAPTADDLGERVILQIVEKGEKYPRKKISRKRKSEVGSGDENEDEDEEIAELIRKDREEPTPRDSLDARLLLSNDFPSVPAKFIYEQLKEHKHLYPTYRAVIQAERAREDTNKSSYDPLKRRRTTRCVQPTNVSAPLRKEYDLVKKRVTKEEMVRAKKKRDAEEDAALDKKAFDDGDIKDCECCFSESPFRKMVHCGGDNPHFFCIGCLASYIKAQLDYQKYKICCMDGGGCKAEFSRASKMKCLDKDMFGRLERVQQQAELREANLPGLETCPFCDFAAICPPIEEDKEFRCEHPDCQLVSCRLCRNKSHLPKSCAESKKEHGIEERHIVEEEMTKALIRSCPKCKVAILKTEGCNKIVCSQCGAYICDVCAKDITKDGYNHFGPGKCAQYDSGYQQGAMTRENIRVQEAEKAAKAKVRADNPDISDADLEIKFSDAIKKREARLGVGRPGNHLAERIAALEGIIPEERNNYQGRADNLLRLQERLNRVQGVMNGGNDNELFPGGGRDRNFVQGFNIAMDQARNLNRPGQDNDNRRQDFNYGMIPPIVPRRRDAINLRNADPPAQPQDRREDPYQRYEQLGQDLARRMRDRDERRDRVRPWLENMPREADRHRNNGFGGAPQAFGGMFGPPPDQEAAAAGMQFGGFPPGFGQAAGFAPAPAQVFLPRENDPLDRHQGVQGRDRRDRRNAGFDRYGYY